MGEQANVERAAWPMRAVLLLGFGAAFGLAFHFLVRGTNPWQWTDDPLRLGGAAFVAVAGIAFAFTLERERWIWSAAFALLAGAVVGLVTWQNGPPSAWGADAMWQLFSAHLAIAIAVPLFQTARDAGRPRLDYQRLHAHSWTNVILWGAAWLFVLAVWILAQLLGSLFDLIGIHVLRDLLRKGWFNWTLIGGALGAATGLLRDRQGVLGLLQRVATAILSVLTPILAAGLVIFVFSLAFTGLQPLWSETKATTPILLTCVLGAFILVNATVGNAPDEEPRSAFLRWSALALAAVMLPLAIVSAVSLGKRIGEYGFTPERLWAGVTVAVALVAGLLYLAAIVRRRLRWPEDVRRANTGLSLGVCGLALLLALPIVSFGAISARDQVARLRAGKVAADKFDWTALRFGFGPAGDRALRALARDSRDPAVRGHAMRALAAKTRWDLTRAEEAIRQAERPRVVTVLPRQVPVPKPLVDQLFRTVDYATDDALIATGGAGRGNICESRGQCFLKWEPGAREAVALHDSCGPDVREGERPGVPRHRVECSVSAAVFTLTDKGWVLAEEIDDVASGKPSDPDVRAARVAVQAGAVELREVSVRQLFLQGKARGRGYR
jgi:hypothetical protein